MNFFEAMKTASAIIDILKLLIAAINELKQSNTELVEKNNEVLAALQTQNEFSLMAANKPAEGENHVG